METEILFLCLLPRRRGEAGREGLSGKYSSDRDGGAVVDKLSEEGINILRTKEHREIPCWLGECWKKGDTKFLLVHYLECPCCFRPKAERLPFQYCTPEDSPGLSTCFIHTSPFYVLHIPNFGSAKSIPLFRPIRHTSLIFTPRFHLLTIMLWRMLCRRRVMTRF